jgi:large subunit ribosomal protein L25
MADKVTVKAEVREARGSNDARRLRAAGKVPVSVYGGGEDTIAAVAQISELAAILRSDSGVNTIFSLDLEGIGVNDVIFHDRQVDPLKGHLMHADLRRIAKGEKLEVTIPIHLIGEPSGLDEGGVLSQVLREIKVLCIPSKIPDFIEVDVSELTADAPIHVSDIKVEEGVEIHEQPEAVVATIIIVKEEELEPSLEEESSEPELVGEETAEDEATEE